MPFSFLSNYKTLIRSDSSCKIGHGHIRRDLVLASYIKDVSFACKRLDGDLVGDINYEVFELQTDDVVEFLELIKLHNFEMIIIDHYDINFDFERSLALESDVKILVLDDLLKRHYCHYLVNVNLFASKQDYKNLVLEDCKILVGKNYILVKDEFYQASKNKYKKIYDRVICLGGSDVLNLSFKIAKKLLTQDENFKISILTTSANQNLQELKNIVKKYENIFLFVDAKDISVIMSKAKRLIISPSTTLNEAFVLGVDFVCIKTASNQEQNYKWLLKNGYKAYEANQICDVNL